MRIGLYGESSNDVLAIANLLSKAFPSITFIDLLRGKKEESIADNVHKTSRIINGRINIKQGFDALVLIRDLDAPATMNDKIKDKTIWFDFINKATGNISLFLLNIEELEALILADIETFNKDYHTKIKFKGNPISQRDPKEFLINHTKSVRKTYNENHAPEIFSKLDYKKVLKVAYFNAFHNELAKKVSLANK